MNGFGKLLRQKALAPVRGALVLTFAGLLAERLLAAFWPLICVTLVAVGAVMLGVPGRMPVEWIWAAATALGVATIWAVGFVVLRLRLPTFAGALRRLDRTLPGRPLAAMLDYPAIGADHKASLALWQAHQTRMAQQARCARPVAADLRLSAADPFALRYVALLVFLVGVLFGTSGPVPPLNMAQGQGDVPLDAPVWEGWIEPPRYTGKPALYLNDQPQGALDVPVGSLITLRMYGPMGALVLSETVSGRTEMPAPSQPVQDFTVQETGHLSIDGPNGRAWTVTAIPDSRPTVDWTGGPQSSALGELRIPYRAKDDYGIEAGEAEITLDLAMVDRRHGLTLPPDPRPALLVPVALPVAGSRQDFTANLTEDLSRHPWANLPVNIALSALDGAEQLGHSGRQAIILLGRRFFDPMAAALIEQRRDLLWTRANAPRVAQILRALINRPDGVFRKETDGLRVRQVIARLETFAGRDLPPPVQSTLAAALWDLALALEEGDLADAAARLRRAQDRLAEAMRRGASDVEISELMDELRRASRDYLRQLAQQGDRDGPSNGSSAPGQDQIPLSQDDLARMMDRIQDLMEQGRMAEAEQALRELQEMMENMRVTQGQGDQGQSAGQQAMEGLSETLRNQQGLSDQAFRDLQEQFNPNAGTGESESNEGRSGGQGRGQSHEGQGGTGRAQGNDRTEGSGADAQSLAERQGALREELGRQQRNLPGAGTPQGDAARDALGRAGDAMERAEGALDQQDLAGAIDNQSQAMEALRDGMRALGDLMDNRSTETDPAQGTIPRDGRSAGQDPLGRDSGNAGANGQNSPLALDQDAQDIARALLDEIRRRSAQQDRPEQERDYLRRLLERF